MQTETLKLCALAFICFALSVLLGMSLTRLRVFAAAKALVKRVLFLL